MKEKQLFEELWILRYVCLHAWFFNLRPPKNKKELSDEILVINSSLKSVLKEKDKLNYLPWLKKGFFKFTDGDLTFDSLRNFRKIFSDKLSNKIPRIAFNCTKGRLAGRLHDFVIELIMTTVQEDQKVFSMSDENNLTEKEDQNIKKVIKELIESRHKATVNFINFFQRNIKNLYLGKDENGKKIEIDFDKEKIDFILLAGQTGSGKSIFHNNLYKELTDKYSSDEIGFVFLDMTRLDFYNWSSDYLIKPVVNNPRKAINVLHELAELKTNKKIFIHIEECDMVYVNRERVKKVFEKLKKKNNFYIIYSTSRLDRDYLSKWMKKFINLRVIFTVANKEDSVFLLGNNIANHFNKAGQRILFYNNQQIVCEPFSEKEVKLLESFKL